MSTLQLEVRWNGRLVGLTRHAVGHSVVVGGSRVEVVADGVVVDGVRRVLAGVPLQLRLGAFGVRISDDAPVAVAKAEPAFDLGWYRTLALMLIVAVGGLVALHLTPRLPDFGDDDLGRGKLMVARAVLAPRPVTPPPPPTKTTAKKPASSATTKAMPKPEGAATRTAHKRDRDRATAMAALAELGLTGPMATAGVFGAANDINTALNQLSGAGTANAGPGMGVRGVGDGGSGVGVGIGVLNGDRDTGKRPGVDISNHHGEHTGAVVKSERVVYVGSLDRSEIQRVMDRAMSRIRYCYERALTADADLEGKLTTMFIIGGAGDVQSANVVQSTLSGEVDGCVNRVLKSLKFPAPKGGGTVNVTYPFVFTAH